MASPQERGRRKAEQRQALASDIFAKHIAETVDMEALLVDKLMQRTNGGSSGLMQQFRKLDASAGGESGVGFKEFKSCLEKFGLMGIRETDARKLFESYDVDKDGTVDFKEFCAGVSKHFNSANKIGESSTDMLVAKNARDKAAKMKRITDRTKWKTLSVNAEEILLEKIEQRIKGGPNSLRMAFRKFDNGNCAVDFKEFRVTLEKLGLQGMSIEDSRTLFTKFDGDGSGEIDYEEFITFVMKSSAKHNTLSIDSSSAQRQAKKLLHQAQRKQEHGIQAHWKYASENLDIEKLLNEKIAQKLSGGPHALRRAFCIFDKKHGDSAEIDFNAFKTGIQNLGLYGIPDKLSKRLFNKFDESGDGMVDFGEFIKRISINHSPLEPRKHSKSKACCKHCCCHKSACKKRFKFSSSRSNSSGMSTNSSLPTLTGRSIY